VMTEVPTDIDDTLRTILPITNMGCYHDFIPFAVDVKMLSIESPTTLTPGLNTPMSVKIQNFGTTVLTTGKTVLWHPLPYHLLFSLAVLPQHADLIHYKFM
jgi:hypothetical protein